MSSYILSPRQKRAFHCVVHLYRPVRASRAASSVGLGAADQVELAYSNVKCRHEPRKEGSVPGVVGRADVDILDTIDILRLHVRQEIAGGWYVEIVAPEELAGEYYKTQGGPMVRNFAAQEQSILMKKTTRPALAGD